MFVDLNGRTFNDGAVLIGNRTEGFGAGFTGVSDRVYFDPGLKRPYKDKYGRLVCSVNTGQVRQNNATGELIPVYRVMLVDELRSRYGINVPVPTDNATTLRKEDWVEMDAAVERAKRNRLRAWSDLRASSTRGGFNAMSKLVLEYQSVSDAGEAIVDMDGVSEGRTDRPVYDLKALPLPITHSDFFFTAREIAVSRNSSTPLDTTMMEMATRRVLEMIERTTIGVETGITFGTRSGDSASAHTGTSTVYGYTNFPYRVTKTDLTTPLGTNPEAVMTDVLEMVETMQTNGYYGPYMLYHSTGYSRYLNDDYFRTGSTSAVRSLRERVMEIEGIMDIRRLDYLTTGFVLLLIQMGGGR